MPTLGYAVTAARLLFIMSTYSYSFADTQVRTKHFFYRVIGYLLLSLSVAQLLTTAVSFAFADKAFSAQQRKLRAG